MTQDFAPAIENSVMGVARGITKITRRQLYGTVVGALIIYQCPAGKVFKIREFNLSVGGTTVNENAYLQLYDSLGNSIQVIGQVNGLQGTNYTAFTDGFYVYPTQQLSINATATFAAVIELIGDELPV